MAAETHQLNTQQIYAIRGLVAALVLGTSAVASSATLYVDGELSQDCPGAYDPAARSCGGGQQDAFSTLAGGAGAAEAGDTVQIRAGIFSEPLVPGRSGQPTKLITFKSHPGELVTLSGLSQPAVQIIGKSYIAVEGLTVTDVQGWGRLESTEGCVIRGNSFSGATSTGTTGGLKLVKSNLCRIIDNTFDDGNDNVVVQESDRNLLAGNTFTKGRHSLLSVRCSNYNVIRGNSFANVDQKAAEIYDCEGVSDAPVKLDATRRNLFEVNRFSLTKASSKSHDYNGIQYAGQRGVVRHNVFHDNQGGGLRFQVYSDEALHNYGHRIYNNTFVRNRCFGLGASEDVAPTRYHDNLVQNNVLYANVSCSGGAEQIEVENTEAVVLTDNAVLDSPPDFVDEPGNNFRLLPGSALIDTAAFVTRTVGAGSGTQMIVADAGYFFDGFGIPNELGDLIQLEDQSATARVVALDLASGALTLSAALTWEDGQRVHLAFNGLGPDQGAHESGVSTHVDGGVPAGDGAVTEVDSAASREAGPGADSDAEGGQRPASDEGCGCRVSQQPEAAFALLGPVLLLFLRRRDRGQ